jgi:hypothetical protein
MNKFTSEQRKEIWARWVDYMDPLTLFDTGDMERWLDANTAQEEEYREAGELAGRNVWECINRFLDWLNEEECRS